jgi:NAD+ diphosphatase
MAKEFKYCPLCGKDTIYEDFKYHFACHNCDYEQYISPKPSAGVILRNSSGHIGLSLRAKNPHKGTFDFVGGFIDPEEEVEQAMIREIKEEISLDIEPNRLVYFTSKHGYYQYKNWMYYTVAFIFELYLYDQEVADIQVKDDIADLQWFSPDKVPLDNITLVDAIVPLRKYLKEKALIPN